METTNANFALQFGAKLKELRIENGLKQREISEILNKNHWNVSDMEVGKQMPSKQDFEKLCDLFNAKPEVFFPQGVPELKEDAPKNPRYKGRNYDPSKDRSMGRPVIQPYKAQRSTGKASEDEMGITLDIDDGVELNSGKSMELGEVEESNIPAEIPIKENNEILSKIVENNENSKKKTKKMEISIPTWNENTKITIVIEEITE
jgi:transcriptional regulator with XRE-family HTH domain